MKLLRRLRSIVSRGAAERDLDDEIALHLALEAEEIQRQGVDARTAAATARRRFGRIESIKDALRTIRGVEPIEDLRRDLLFAARALRRRPGFALVVVLTLVVGLASATTIFGIVYGILWAPLPYGDPDRVVTVWQTDHAHGIDRGPVSLPNLLDWRERSRAFSALAAAEPFGVRYAAPEGPERFPAWRVTDGFFAVLRATPLLGRTFASEEYRPGNDAVAVLDYDLWRSRFNGDSAVVGRTLTLNDRPVRVIGVMPRAVRFPAGPGIWVPKVPQPAEMQLRNAAYYVAVGRLAPGVSLDRARRDLTGVAAGLAREYPVADHDVGVSLVPLRDELVGHVRGRLLLLFASVGLLLLLTGANLTALLMARAVEREGELQIRTALGATRRRIALQVMAERLVLGAIGWGVSLVLAVVALNAVRAMGAGLLPRADDVHVGMPAAVFGGVLVLAFALTPARSPRAGRHVQRILVVSEVSLALVLVIAAGLFVRSVRELLHVDPGFTSSNVLAVSVQTEHLYPSDTARAAFVRTVEDRLAAIPGVQRAGVTTSLPFGSIIGTYRADFEIVGRPAGSARERPSVRAAAISPGYLPALGIPMRAGRAFTATDDATHPAVVIVSAAFARQYWGNAEPVGERLTASFDGDPMAREIVGVVADVHDAGLDQPPEPEVYLPYAQAPSGGVEFVLHTSVAARSVVGTVRREIRGVNGAMPIASVATLDELLEASTRAPRVVLLVLGAFASVALALAGLGIFGVMTHLTRSRTKEVSIRLALGATSREILGLILGEALGLAACGAVIGITAAVLLGRSVSAMLFAVSPIDPLTLGAGVVLLLAVASGAAYVPARRAATVDAVRALRD